MEETFEYALTISNANQILKQPPLGRLPQQWQIYPPACPGISFRLEVYPDAAGSRPTMRESTESAAFSICPDFSWRKSSATCVTASFGFKFGRMERDWSAPKLFRNSDPPQQQCLEVGYSRKKLLHCLNASGGLEISVHVRIQAQPSQIRVQYESGQNAGVELRLATGETVFVSQELLCKHSRKFDKYFAMPLNQRGGMHPDPRTVIRSFDADAVKALLQFFHEDLLEFTDRRFEALALALLKLSYKVECAALGLAAERALIPMLSSENIEAFADEAYEACDNKRKDKSKALALAVRELLARESADFLEKLKTPPTWEPRTDYLAVTDLESGDTFRFHFVHDAALKCIIPAYRVMKGINPGEYSFSFGSPRIKQQPLRAAAASRNGRWQFPPNGALLLLQGPTEFVRGSCFHCCSINHAEKDCPLGFITWCIICGDPQHLESSCDQKKKRSGGINAKCPCCNKPGHYCTCCGNFKHLDHQCPDRFEKPGFCLICGGADHNTGRCRQKYAVGFKGGCVKCGSSRHRVVYCPDRFKRASPARSAPEDLTVSTNHYGAAAGNYYNASPQSVKRRGQIGAENEGSRLAGARGLGAAAGHGVASFGRGRGRGAVRSGIAATSPPTYQALAVVGNRSPQFQAAGSGSLQLAASTDSFLNLGSYDVAATLEQPNLPSGQMSFDTAGPLQQQMQPQPSPNAGPPTSFAAVQGGYLGEVPAQASPLQQQPQYPQPPTFQFADEMHLQSRAGVSNGEAFSGFPSQLRDALPFASFSTPLPASALPSNRYPNLREFLPPVSSVAAPQFAMPPTTAFGAGGYNVPLPPFAYYPPYSAGTHHSFPAAVSIAQAYSVQPTPGMAHNGFGAPMLSPQFFGYAHGHLNAVDSIESLMRLAYEGNDPALLAALHGNPALGSAVDINGNTLLHYAIDGNKPATVRLILTYAPKIENAQQAEGASLTHAPTILNVQNADGASPLCFAIEKGALECVRVLLADQSRNINPNLQVHGTKYAALHLAVARRSADVLELLLSQDFHAFPLNLTLQDKDCCTAFHLAVKDGFMDATEMLLTRQKALVNHRVKPAGYTALHYALLGNNVGLVRYLLQQGANPLLAAWADNNLPLHLAIMLRKLEFAEVLVLRGDKAQLNAHGGQGETPLSLAWQMWQKKQAAIDSNSFARLLDFSKQPPIKFRDIEDHIPAVDAPELCMVLCLLANGADPTIVNQITGKPPLDALSDQILAMIVRKFTGFALLPIINDPVCRVCKRFLADIEFEPCGCKLVCLQCYRDSGWNCACGRAIEAKKYDGKVFSTASDAADQPHPDGGVSLGIPPFQ